MTYPRLGLCLCLSLSLPLAACADDGQSDDGGDEVGETAGGTDTGESGGAESGESGTETGDTGDTGDTGETGDPPPEFFEVGVDVHDLSPDDTELGEDFYMGGYGGPFQRGPAEGVHDPIYVRSMAIGYGEDDGAIVAIVDTIGLGNQWTRAIRAGVAEATGLSPELVVIGSTHTHSGPDFQGLWGGVPDVYRERVTDEIVASMAAAWDAREPARLELASTTADNRNRRGWDFTDEELFALQAFALDDDAPIGVLVAFAAHPVILGDENLLLSRGFCGYAVDALEAELGAPALYFNGVQGDVSPDVADGMFADDFEKAEAYGQHVADRTLLALAETEAVEVAFERDYREFSLDVTNELFLLAAQADLLDYDFDMDGDQATVSTQSAYFQLGDNQAEIVAFPGESLTRNGLPVKEAMSASHKAILGLSGDALGYFVPGDEWMTGLNGDYEESVSVGMAAGDTTRDILIEMISGQ